MPRSVAFLGGINVGGHRVKMDRLRELFEELKLARVETFIASGNVLFDHAATLNAAKLETRLEQHLEATLGYGVPTYLRTIDEVARVVAGVPFADPVHVCFLRRALTPEEAAALPEFSTPVDDLVASGRELYWNSRAGAGSTQINWRRFNKRIGVTMTARNITMLRRLLGRKPE